MSGRSRSPRGAAGIALGAALWLFAVACADSRSDEVPARFGFHASWTEDQDLGQSASWTAGPHAGFAEIGPSRLAAGALEWFVAARDAEGWPDPGLELAYRSGDASVTVYYDAESPVPFERQLEEWFECFPPDDGDVAEDGDLHWGARLARRGSATGTAAGEGAAMQSLRALIARHGGAPLLAQATFSLSRTVQRAPRTLDSYSAEASAAEIEELPARLRDELARHGVR